MIWQTTSTDSAATERLGELLGSLLESPAVIELRADLGGGKTTFTRGLVSGLGSKNPVSSPSFTLNKIYRGKNLEVHHFDFYRLPEPGLMSEQLKEALDNQRAITVVEWSDIVREVLPSKRMIIEFKSVNNNPDERHISFSYPESISQLIKRLEANWMDSKA